MPSQSPTTNPSAPTPRQLLEQAVESLIAYLDAIDPDPDLEEGGDDEPSLGWNDMEGRYGRYSPQPEHDLEQQCEDEGAAARTDDEPSLGWQNEGSQRCLYPGADDDREDECEDEGAEHGVSA